MDLTGESTRRPLFCGEVFSPSMAQLSSNVKCRGHGPSGGVADNAGRNSLVPVCTSFFFLAEFLENGVALYSDTGISLTH